MVAWISPLKKEKMGKKTYALQKSWTPHDIHRLLGQYFKGNAAGSYAEALSYTLASRGSGTGQYRALLFYWINLYIHWFSLERLKYNVCIKVELAKLWKKTVKNILATCKDTICTLWLPTGILIDVSFAEVIVMVPSDFTLWLTTGVLFPFYQSNDMNKKTLYRLQKFHSRGARLIFMQPKWHSHVSPHPWTTLASCHWPHTIPYSC